MDQQEFLRNLVSNISGEVRVKTWATGDGRQKKYFIYEQNNQGFAAKCVFTGTLQNAHSHNVLRGQVVVAPAAVPGIVPAGVTTAAPVTAPASASTGAPATAPAAATTDPVSEKLPNYVNAPNTSGSNANAAQGQQDNPAPEGDTENSAFNQNSGLTPYEVEYNEVMLLKRRRAYYEVSLLYEQLAIAQREKYKIELELLKMELELGFTERSDFTKHLNTAPADNINQ